MWLGVYLTMDTKKASCVEKRLNYMLTNMLTILGSMVNMIGGTCMTT